MIDAGCRDDDDEDLYGYGSPYVFVGFQWVAHGLPMVVIWYSYGSPMGFLGIPRTPPARNQGKI